MIIIMLPGITSSFGRAALRNPGIRLIGLEWEAGLVTARLGQTKSNDAR
jgi:hypothetical protein